ncbi:MAG: hypothetical protein WCD53_04330 [Microcoleus sp.]
MISFCQVSGTYSVCWGNFLQVRSLVFIWCDRLQDLPQKKINLTAA